MAKSKRLVKKKNIVIIAVILVLVVAVIVSTIFTYKKIHQAMYLEKANLSNHTMNVIGKNIKVGFDDKWLMINYFSDEILSESYQDESDITKKLQQINSRISSHEQFVFNIDADGFCHTQDEKTFRWGKMSLLAVTKDQEACVLNFPSLNLGGDYLCFLKKLPQNIKIDGKKDITHMCLACDMRSLDIYFESDEYGENAVSYIIQSTGSPLYAKGGSGELNSIYNMFSTFRGAEFLFGGSYDSFESDIKNLEASTSIIEYRDKVYFVSYSPVGISDWVAVRIVEESFVGRNTSHFTLLIVEFISILSVVVLVCVIALAVITVVEFESQQKSQQKLYVSAEVEHSANLAKTKFLSAMSHDIRTPMNTIVGLTGIASHYIDNKEKMQDCLQKIEFASNHMLSLINDILDISRVEAGKVELKPVEFSLSDTITAISTIVRPQANAKGQTLNITLTNIMNENLHADELRINQIFLNLLTNAVKYTPEGGKISVDLKQEIIPAKVGVVRLVYTVSDNGIGMSNEFQKHMYDSFARSTDKRTNKIQGSGLGLAICKQFIDIMGGEIVCKSTLNVGTTFTVTLDVEISKSDTNLLYLPPVKMLLVASDESKLLQTSQILDKMGAKPEFLLDRDDTITQIYKKIQDGDFKIMLVDLNDDHEKTKSIIREAKDKFKEKCPKILFTCPDYSLVEHEFSDLEIDGYLNKPFLRTNLYNALDNLLHFDTKKAEENFDDLKGLKILVAEDNDLNWEITEEMLKMYNIYTRRAENGSQCVEIINASRPGDFDAILMDIQMPIMDGRMATRVIRYSDNVWARDIPIIAMTAESFAEDIQACINAGMNDHIAKPVEFKKLLKILRKTVKNKR